MTKTPAQPSKRLAVVTCMDARIDVFALLGLDAGEAHVIRNAGGIVSDDAIRSLSISQRLLGTTDVHVIQHTGCGLLGFTDEEFAADLERDVGARPSWSAQAFSDLETSVREQVARLRESPFLTATKTVRGFILDIDSGELREIEDA